MANEPQAGSRDRQDADYDLPEGKGALSAVRKSLDEKASQVGLSEGPDDALLKRMVSITFEEATRLYIKDRWLPALRRLRVRERYYSLLHYALHFGVMLAFALIVWVSLVYSRSDYPDTLNPLFALIGLLLYTTHELLRIEERRQLYRKAVARLRREGWMYAQRQGPYDVQKQLLAPPDSGQARELRFLRKTSTVKLRAARFLERTEFIVEAAEGRPIEALYSLDDTRWLDNPPAEHGAEKKTDQAK